MGMCRHSPFDKTRETERARLVDKMGLSGEQAEAVLNAAGIVKAVPAATFALRAETACGGREQALALIRDFQRHLCGPAYCMSRLREVGIEWWATSSFPLDLAGAEVLLQSEDGVWDRLSGAAVTELFGVYSWWAAGQ